MRKIVKWHLGNSKLEIVGKKLESEVISEWQRCAKGWKSESSKNRDKGRFERHSK